MTYLLLVVAFWLGMLIERHFVHEPTELPKPEPKAKPKIGSLYWSKSQSRRLRVAAIHGDAVVLADGSPDAYIDRRRTWVLLVD